VLSEEWSVKPARELTDRLSQLVGHERVRALWARPAP
jgi:hypothetical protein